MNTIPHYPGKGIQLRAASAAGVPTDPEVLNIPNGGQTEGFAAHDCKEFSIQIVVNTANATGDCLLQAGDDDSFTNTITHATITTNTFRLANYKSGGPLVGRFRIRNNSGQTIKVFLQKIS